MAIQKVKLPDNTVEDIHDARIGSIDSALSSSSENPLKNKAIYNEFAKVTYVGDTLEDVEGYSDDEPEYEPEVIIGGGDENVIEAITFNGAAVPVDSSTKTAAITASIPSAPGTLSTTATTAQSTSASEALSGSITLHKVAKTGTYSDLIGTPTIPTVPTISTNITSDATSDVKTASPKAVKTYVDNVCGDIEALLAAL